MGCHGGKERKTSRVLVTLRTPAIPLAPLFSCSSFPYFPFALTLTFIEGSGMNRESPPHSDGCVTRQVINLRVYIKISFRSVIREIY